MTIAAGDIVRLASGFCAGSAPISFYDAFALVRLARRSGDLCDAALHALLAVHDHAAATNGAKTVLADFLRSYAQRQEKERALATRLLSPRDTGKTVRARTGTALRLAVTDSISAADDWSVARLEGPARLTRYTPGRANTEHADFAVELLAPGQVVLELTAPAAAGTRPARPGPRQLCLRIVVEA